MDIDVKDIAGLKKPLEKLIEVVSVGIGTLYRPRAIRNDADAEAYRIRAIAEANVQATAIESLGNTNSQIKRIELLSRQYPELVERAKVRLLTREVEGQLNVEAVVEAAASNLPEYVSENPVADDWRRKFFTEAENVCDRDLQIFWGKLLAGEVAAPGRYSLRTLDVLKHMSKREAELLVNAAKICTSEGYIYLPGNANALGAYGLNYGDLMSLREAGLVHESDMLHTDFSKLPTVLKSITTSINGLYIQMTHENFSQIRLPTIVLTKAGKELVQLVPPELLEPYLIALGQYLRSMGMTAKKGILTETVPGQGVMTFDVDL